MRFLLSLSVVAVVFPLAGCNFSNSSSPENVVAEEGSTEERIPLHDNAIELAAGDRWRHMLSPEALGLPAEGALADFNAEQGIREAADPYFLIGQSFADLKVDEWANSSPLTMEGLKGRVVVVRFWTDEGPYCEASMKAMQRLADEFADRPVTFVGIYHATDPYDERDWELVQVSARNWGLKFPLAYDRQWRTLNDWWRSRLHELPTTPTFVISAAGRVEHLHPGPVFFPSNKPTEKLCNEDFFALKAAIKKTLGESIVKNQ